MSLNDSMDRAVKDVRKIIWGNVSWTEDKQNGTVTVASEAKTPDNQVRFEAFTVEMPVNLVKLECGHAFRVGTDFSEVVTINGVEQDRTHIHCIQCQAPKMITFWENSHHLDIPTNLAF